MPGTRRWVLWFPNPTCKCAKTLVFQDAVDQKYQHGIPNAFVGAIVLQMRTGQGKKLDIQVCISSVQHGKTYCFDGDAAVWWELGHVLPEEEVFLFHPFIPTDPVGETQELETQTGAAPFLSALSLWTGKFNWKQYWHPQLRHVPTALQDLESLIARPRRQNSLPVFCF